jgi:hypothetical protein
MSKNTDNNIYRDRVTGIYTSVFFVNHLPPASEYPLFNKNHFDFAKIFATQGAHRHRS